MSLSINTNQTSLFAQNQLGEIRQSQAGALRSLASGQRINSAAENPAVAAIVQQFAAQIAGSDQAARNLNDGVSLTQVADGAIGQLQANSGRLRELAVAAGNGTLSAADRGALQAEADQLVQANNDIVKQTNFNGNPLLQGGSPLGFQSGANAGQQTSLAAANLAAAPASGGLFSLAGGIDLSSAAKASQTLGNLDTDLDTLASSRASFGAASNAFTAEIGNLQTRADNLAAARSRSNDTDYAAASAQLAQQQILGQANIAVQSQANASASQVLGLLR
ncbi:MAG: flagellin [Chitinivorax sp.]